MADTPEPDWTYATWEGSRRAMIRQALKLTVRQRLQALEEMSLTSQTLARSKKTTAIKPTRSKEQ